MTKVRKAVIPAAGFGTRFLPFTKAVPKELIPLVDKPVIQYVIEEAASANIKEALIIVSTGKEAIMQHFNPAYELENRLATKNKVEILKELQDINNLMKISYIYQPELNGLGGAVKLAKSFVGDEPFALLLGDTVMSSNNEKSITEQLLEVFNTYKASTVALEEVPLEKVSSYGIAKGAMLTNHVMDIEKMVEKPAVDQAPSRLAFAARYIFTPEIFTHLENTLPGKDNEIQLTDAMNMLLKNSQVLGCKINGKRHDIGSKMGFLKGTVEYGLKNPLYKEQFTQFLRDTLKKLDDEN
jgi:UTP--glucose-1-phosphate uridylyltransferase